MDSSTRPPRKRSTTRPAVNRRRRRADGPPPDQPALFDHQPHRPDTYLTTVYRLDTAPTMAGLRRALHHPYLREKGFTATPRRVAGRPALLVDGVVRQPRAEYCDVIARLTGHDIALGHSSGGSVLLLAVDDRVYALTYGTLGRHMIDPSAIDRGFGIEFAVRALLPDHIRQVRRRVLGASGRVDRSQVPGGQPIRWYTIDKWNELVGQVAGQVDNPRLADCRRTGRPTLVEGSDSLRIRLCTEPDGLLADLREIDRVCRQESPLSDLEFITQLRPLRSDDPRMKELRDAVDERLGLANPPAFGLAVPGPLLGEIEQVRSYRIRIARSRRPATSTTELDLDAVLAHTRRVPDGRRWTGLQATDSLTLCTDEAGKETITTTPLSRWLTAEVPVGAHRLLLHEGTWYEMGAGHQRFLREEIERLLDRPASLVLPAWPTGMPEKDYNDRVAGVLPGFVPLDRKLLRTAQHRHGFEACDLLGPDDELIHVKRAKGSSPLSHLFAQGVTSVDALCHQHDARTRFVETVRRQQPGRSIDESFRPRKVVYGIALDPGRALTVTDLYTFAQVALYHAAKTLRVEGVDVEVVSILPR
ncbi:hypothetical protein GCM10012279_48570 [Micromonospora yangpuensis]|uniref:Sporadically distributed protein, TIGR04141 family n=1 Tax=Micromonospora yangpuensis TaxID=683228 RepID=A0A1C6UU24_9ACTN|nr:hypothetical protein GCM10012279_48570 [Micromonospora yangpuensis]SCL57501.1 sporadically distributed protein, TIGR04141 family [Micromonospora yangpuensis]